MGSRRALMRRRSRNPSRRAEHREFRQECAGTIGPSASPAAILSGTYMTFADELAEVLDDGDNLRVLPIVTYGAASNLDDLLYLRGVDVAVTQSDVFEYFQTQRKIAGLQNRIHYIIRLPVSEVHILAKTQHPQHRGSARQEGEFRTCRKRFELDRLDHLPARRHSGRTDTVRQPAGAAEAPVGRDRCADPGGRQADRLLRQDPGEGRFPPGADPVHQDLFRLLHARRVHQGRVSDPDLGRRDHHARSAFRRCSRSTIGRCRAIARAGCKRLVERMFANWEKFQSPPRHPKWKEVNLAATVPGWTRWAPAEEILQSMRARQAQAAPVTRGGPSANLSECGARAAVQGIPAVAAAAETLAVRVR